MFLNKSSQCPNKKTKPVFCQLVALPLYFLQNKRSEDITILKDYSSKFVIKADNSVICIFYIISISYIKNRIEMYYFLKDNK